MSRGQRGPTPEELRLWHEVAKSITPIGRGKRPATPTAARAEGRPAAKPGPKSPAKSKPIPTRSVPPPYRPPTSAQPKVQDVIDRRTRGRVARGRINIDTRIDLHGMTQQAAHRRLTMFLHDAQAGGARLALVITGKGDLGARPAWGEAERGVLRRMVPQWLGSAELRPFVVGFGEAARHLGGSGALYVQVRRRHG